MSHLFESIKVLNGRVRNLRYHQERVDSACAELSTTTSINLRKYIRTISLPKKGIHKLRVSYNTLDQSISHRIIPYIEKPINSLAVVETTHQYSHKYEEREFINKAYAQKEEVDDILFVTNNIIKDTSYCNVAFFDGKEWLTPKHPMLRGTMRAKLISKGIIKEHEIKVQDLDGYTKCRLFNAMINWSARKELEVNKISVKFQ